MTENEIELALKSRLGNYPISGFSYAWPNLDAVNSKPYLHVQIVRVGTSDRTAAGGGRVSRGKLVVTVVTASNISTELANSAAQKISDMFPFPLRIPAGDGFITVTKPADIREGFPDAGDWRTPVIIDYIAS